MPSRRIMAVFLLIGFAAMVLVRTSDAQCQSTLAYLASQIPATGAPKLSSLRQQILDTSIVDAMARMKAQGMSIETGIELANKQADADEANLPQLEQGVRAAIEPGGGDSAIQMLRRGEYGYSSDAGDALSALEAVYVANVWGALANRETAKQFRCFLSAGSPGYDRTLGASPRQDNTYNPRPQAEGAQSTFQPQNFPIIKVGSQPSGSQTAMSGQSPTLASTAEFIQNKLKNPEGADFPGTVRGGFFDGHTVVEHYFIIDTQIDPTKCTLSAVGGTDRSDTSNPRYHDQRFVSISVPLAAVGSVDVALHNAPTWNEYTPFYNQPVYGLTLWATQPRFKRSEGWPLKNGKPDKAKTTTVDRAEFFFLDQSLTIRVAKAMAHAVELCGGGKPFVPAKPEPKKEPEPF